MGLYNEEEQQEHLNDYINHPTPPRDNANIKNILKYIAFYHLIISVITLPINRYVCFCFFYSSILLFIFAYNSL